MEDIKSIQEEIEPSIQIGSGNLLAAERKKQNKSVEEIAEKLNLSVTQLRTIELDQTEGLPGPTYVRGYIRGYAKLLGLDAEQILESYINSNWEKGQSLSGLPQRIGTANESKPGFFTPVKLLILLGFAGVSLFLWYAGIFDKLFTKNTTSVQAQVEQQQQVPEVEASAANPAATVSTLDAAVNQPQFKTGFNTLSLNFNQTSWVDIRDENKKLLAFQSYLAGSDLTVESDLKMEVFIGNADGVKATLNGQPFDLAAHKEGKYAKLSIEAPVAEEATSSSE